MIARAKQKLRADVNGPFLVRRKRDRRVPIVAKFLIVIRPRFDVARLVRATIYSPNLAALILGVNEICVSRVWEHPEPVAAVHILPAMIRDSAGILRIANPGAVILQSAINPIRI